MVTVRPVCPASLITKHTAQTIVERGFHLISESIEDPLGCYHCMRNEKPCKNCRSRRRKCKWIKASNKCERCAETHVECIPVSDDSMASVQDGNEQLLEWWDQVSQLEDMLDTVNASIQDSSGSSNSSDEDSSIGTPEVQEPEWTLTVVNGRVRLESTIKNFQELMMYNQASIRYLSPLAGLLQRESIRFEGMSASVAIASFGLVLRYSPHKPRRYQIKELPYQIDYRHEIDHLVRLYLARYNECVGLIHVPTFMKYYRRLKDPMESPMTLGICVDAIAYFYPQLDHSPLEKRQMADFFYTRCRNMLLDMFDQPSRRLEAIMTTNLLMQYLQDVMMEYTEARRLVTIAKLVCDDIQANHLQSLTPVERVLFDRHCMSLHVWQSLIFVFLEGRFDFSGVPDVPVTLLDQEPEMVTLYLNMWKAVARLLGCPYITILMKQIAHAVHGEPYELSLDMIMQFEPMMREWWAGLLPDFRIFDDPFSPLAYMAIEEVTSSIVLMPLAVLHGLSALLHSSLLKPRLLTVDDQLTEDMIAVLRQKAISATLTSTKTLVYVMKRNLEIDLEALPSVILSVGYLMGAMHAVCTIVNNCAEIQLPDEVLDLLFRCFSQINALLPPGHQIPASSSPLEPFMKTLKVSPIDIYEKFPMPGYALVSDIFFTCFSQLERGFRLAL